MRDEESNIKNIVKTRTPSIDKLDLSIYEERLSSLHGVEGSGEPLLMLYLRLYYLCLALMPTILPVRSSQGLRPPWTLTYSPWIAMFPGL